ncbi:hypothetical protein PLANTIT3_60389 [Plantibacter sp. T3]|nr:hypothetical protein PLANTIT3_60389 [Plantibacter sp. T3]
MPWGRGFGVSAGPARERAPPETRAHAPGPRSRQRTALAKGGGGGMHNSSVPVSGGRLGTTVPLGGGRSCGSFTGRDPVASGPSLGTRPGRACSRVPKYPPTREWGSP